MARVIHNIDVTYDEYELDRLYVSHEHAPLSRWRGIKESCEMKSIRPVLFLLLALYATPAAGRAALRSVSPMSTSQTATVQMHGPALLARVSGGTLDAERFVIGCRGDGALGDTSPHVNAYLEVTFDVVRRGAPGRSHSFVIERSIPVPRHCDGVGYLSRALSMQELFDLDPGHGDAFYPVNVRRVALAFFVGGRWDSNLDSNYAFDVKALGQSPMARTASGPAAQDGVAAALWSFLADRLR